MAALAVGPEPFRQVVELLAQLLVGEVLVGQLLPVHLRAVGAGQLGQRALGGVAERVHREQPLLRGRVAGAEHHVLARRPVYVGHAELGVTEDLTPARGVSVEPTPPGIEPKSVGL